MMLTVRLQSFIALSIFSFFAVAAMNMHVERASRHNSNPRHIRAPSSPIVYSGISTASVLIVIVGSVHRAKNIDVLSSTYSKHFPVLVVTEANSECMLCTDGFHFEHSTMFNHRLLFPGYSTFLNQSTGWYCFQQRYLQALKKAVHLASSPAPRAQSSDGSSSDASRQRDSLPAGSSVSWVVMTEDDSVINMAGLMRLLKAKSQNGISTHPVALGCEFGGGGGFIFNRAAINKFQKQYALVHRYVWSHALNTWEANPAVSVVDACVRQQLGGTWCLLHSDWAMSKCANLAEMHLTCMEDRMHQLNRYNPNSTHLNKWIASMVTSHYHSTPEKIAALAADIAKYDPLTAAPRTNAAV